MNIVQTSVRKKQDFQGTQNIILEWRQGTNKYLYMYVHNIARRQREREREKKNRHCTNNKKYINKKAERLETDGNEI